MDTTSAIERDFFLGFIKIHVLHHAGEGPVYGTALIEELERHGYRVGPSLVYPLLHQLEEQGYLARDDRPVSGKVRKYYTLTSVGAQALDDIKGKIAELVAEVINPATDRAPDTPTLQAFADQLASARQTAERVQQASPGTPLDMALRALALAQDIIANR